MKRTEGKLMLKAALTLAAWFSGIIALACATGLLLTGQDWFASKSIIAIVCYLLAMNGLKLAKITEGI